MTLRIAVDALADGARHALPVAIACALVGVIIGVINLTGVATDVRPATSSRSAATACSCRCC